MKTLLFSLLVSVGVICCKKENLEEMRLLNSKPLHNDFAFMAVEGKAINYQDTLLLVKQLEHEYQMFDSVSIYLLNTDTAKREVFGTSYSVINQTSMYVFKFYSRKLQTVRHELGVNRFRD